MSNLSTAISNKNPASLPASEAGGVGQRTLSAVRRFIRSSPVGAVSLAIWIIIIVMAIFAPQIAPHDPLEPTYVEEGPSAEHILGTDRLGRDVLSRIIFGARITLIVAFISVLLGDAIGFLWGIASGYLGERFYLTSQRLVDVLMSFPGLILALLLMVVLVASESVSSEAGLLVVTPPALAAVK